MGSSWGGAIGGVAALIAALNSVWLARVRKRSLQRHQAVTREINSWQTLATAIGEQLNESLERERNLRTELDSVRADAERRGEAFRTEISSYRTEIVGLKNWLREKGYELPPTTTA